MVSGVEVYKTTSVVIPSGGIASLNNIKIAEPLSYGDKASGSVKGIYDTDAETTTHQISGLYSKVIDEKFGVLLSGSYQNREFVTDTIRLRRYFAIDVNDWVGSDGVTRSGTFYQPSQALTKRNQAELTRLNASAVFQYAFSDDIIATVDS